MCIIKCLQIDFDFTKIYQLNKSYFVSFFDHTGVDDADTKVHLFDHVPCQQLESIKSLTTGVDKTLTI